MTFDTSHFALTDEPLGASDDVPLFGQVCARIRDAILNGTLAPGTRLPATRSLASQLAVSRSTVERAYEVLAGEGYVIGRGAAGTMVDPHLDRRLLQSVRQQGAVNTPTPAASKPWPQTVQPFQLGQPSMDKFPRKLWARLGAQCARTVSTASMTYQNPMGYVPLREELVRYLAVSRGITCGVDQVCITSGFQSTFALICQILLRTGDSVWMEDPGYYMARRALQLSGLSVTPVPVREDGLDVSAGVARAPDAKLVLVTPTHQAPLGVTLSLSRRLELLDWAARQGAWIVEDDYDSEFRYSGRPLPALKSLDGSGRVLYVGTFSKVLFPGLRLGYLVVPPADIDRFRRALTLLAPSGSSIEQALVARFFSEGHFARHIKRMRELYAERRSALLQAVSDILGGRVQCDLQAGGMHLVARLAQGEDDVDMIKRARANGLAPDALSRWVAGTNLHPALLLGFTNVPATSAARDVRRLHDALIA